jgi:hypothetical protein
VFDENGRRIKGTGNRYCGKVLDQGRVGIHNGERTKEKSIKEGEQRKGWFGHNGSSTADIYTIDSKNS